MKQLFFAAILFAAATSCKKGADNPQPTAEVTVQASDVKKEYAAGKTITFFDAKIGTSSNITVPVEGKDQTWDFSAVEEESSYTSSFTKAGEDFSPTGYSIKSQQHFVGNQLEPMQYEYNVAGKGWLSLGLSFKGFTLNLPDLGATIKYADQSSRFNKPVLFSPSFPIKYGSSDSYDNAVREERFTVFAPAFGLNNTPGSQKYTVSGTAQCIASGKLTLKGFSKPMNALVVKMRQHLTVNFLLGGAPAPKQLLDMLGLTDGRSSDADWYDIYSADGEGYLGSIYVDSNNNLQGAAFEKK